MKQWTGVWPIDWLPVGSTGLIAHTQGSHSVEEQENKCIPRQRQTQRMCAGLIHCCTSPGCLVLRGAHTYSTTPELPGRASSALRRRKAWDLSERAAGSWVLLHPLPEQFLQVPSGKTGPAPPVAVELTGQEDTESGMETNANCKATVIEDKCS